MGIITPAAVGATVIGAAPASAAGPTHLPHYGTSADFPTWLFRSTKLCVDNDSWSYGYTRIQSRSGAAPEYLSVAPWTERCIYRWWGAWPVTVTNISDAYLIGSSY